MQPDGIEELLQVLAAGAGPHMGGLLPANGLCPRAEKVCIRRNNQSMAFYPLRAQRIPGRQEILDTVADPRMVKEACCAQT